MVQKRFTLPAVISSSFESTFRIAIIKLRSNFLQPLYDLWNTNIQSTRTMRPKNGKRHKQNTNREAHDPGISLPSSLLEEFSTTDEVLASNNEAPGRSFTTTTRKQARKQKRLAKKQSISNAQKEWKARRYLHIAKSHTSVSSAVPHNQEAVASKNHANVEEEGPSEREPEDTPSRKDDSTANGGGQKIRKRKRNPSEKPDEERCPENVQPEDPDARKAKELEVLLGIDRKRKKRESEGNSFSYADVFGEGEDDLVDLLEFCDRLPSKANKSQQKVGTTRNGTGKNPSSGNAHSQNGVSSSDDLQDSEYDDAVSADDLQESEYDDAVSPDDLQESENDDAVLADDLQESENDDAVSADIGSENDDGDSVDENASYHDDNQHEDDEIQPVSSHTRPHPSENSVHREAKEPGFTVTGTSPVGDSPCLKRCTTDAEGDTGEGPSTCDSSIRKVGKYVPPSARQRDERMTGGMKRRLRGLLNRVADVNASGIADSLVQLFRSADNGLSMRELSNLYANAALDSSRDGSGVAYVNPYVQSHAAIAAHLGKQVDLIILATLLVSAVRRMVSALESSDSAKSNGFQNEDDVAAFEESRGECFGYVALLCALYTRHAISSHLVYEIVKFVANSLNGLRLEILLFMLRQVGAQLRVDDPVGLKDVIEFIYDRFAALRESTPVGSDSSSGPSPQDTKLQVMLDLVNDIKNNKLRKSAVKEAQAKFSWASVPDDPLSASMNDLRDDDFIKMRWWDDTMGLTVSERRGVTSGDQTGGDVSVPVVVNEGPDLATLASTLRLNTEYRRALFRAIMGSANVKDAFERLEGMGAFESKDNHNRDTALVILHCCGSERSFNPFYAVLAEKVCRHSRKLRFTFEFALWDVFKAIPGSVKVAAMAKRKRSNYTQLLTYLWMSGAMSVSVLRCVPDFEECGVLEKEFYTDTVAQLMRRLSSEEKDRLAPFEKLAQETWNGVDDFRISFALFLRRSVGPCLTGRERSLQTKAVDLLENVRTVKS